MGLFQAPYSDLSTICKSCFDYDCLTKKKYNQDQQVHKQLLCLLILHWHLDELFDQTKNTATKQNIRNIQVLVFFIILSTSSCAIKAVIHYLQDPEDLEIPTHELVATSTFALCLQTNYSSLFSNYLSYGKLVDTKAFDGKLMVSIYFMLGMGEGYSFFGKFTIEFC